MADAETAGKGKTKRKGGGKTILLMVAIGCVIPFGLPTLIVCLGLIPTVVALCTDTDENRSGLATIAYLNFAGVLPFLIELWHKGQTMDAAMSIVRDPASWVIMLGSAGVGHVIMYIVPPIVASIILFNQENRLRTLREAAQQFESIWGADVMTEKPLVDILRARGM